MQNHISRFVQVAAALLLLVSGTHVFAQNDLTSVEQDTVDQQAVKVTFLMYSGRPNPTMVVRDRGQIEKINQLYAESFTTGQTVETPDETYPRLGYNGVLIETLSDAVGSKMPSAKSGNEIVVNRGRVKSGAPSVGQTGTPADRTLQSEQASDATANRAEAVPYDPDKKLELFLLGLAKDRGVLDEQAASVVETSIAE